MWAAKSAGVAAGGSGGVILAKHYGWPTLFVLMAVSIWLVMLLPILIREAPLSAAGADAQQEQQRIGKATRLFTLVRDLRDSFGFQAPRVGALFAIAGAAGYSIVGAFTTRMQRVDLGFSEEQIATMAGLDPASSVFGALLGGYLADRLGVRRGIAVGVVLISASLLGFGLAESPWRNFSFMVTFSVVSGFWISAFNAATLGFYMTLSNPRVGATQFATFMALSNLCYAITSPAGGWMADNLGYVPTTLLAAGIQLASLGLLYFCRPEDAEARFRSQLGQES